MTTINSVADGRIGDAVDGARIVERNGDAGAVLADDAARDGERRGRHRRAVADVTIQALPSVITLASRGRVSRMRTMAAPSVGALEMGIANAAIRLARQRREIDAGVAVEDQPHRVGAMEHGGRRRRREGKFDTQAVAFAV